MRFSQLFGQTLREPPAEAEAASYARLARGGFIRPSEGSRFTMLPLGMAALARLELLAQAELDRLGAQQISPPVGIRALAGSEIQSYRQLPRLLYSHTELSSSQPRPRLGLYGAALSPCLESYALCADEASRAEWKQTLTSAADSIFSRLELPVIPAVAVPTPGSLAAESLVFLTPDGNLGLLRCPACGYAAGEQIARRSKPVPAGEPALPLEKVPTPDCKTIDALARFLDIPTEKTAKAVFLMATMPEGERFVFAILRGDMELSEARLAGALRAKSLRPASEAEIRAVGAEPGYASPVGIRDALVVVDDLVPRCPNLVAGANQAGFHLRNVNCGRDFTPTLVHDLALARNGDPCPDCSQPLEPARGAALARVETFDTTDTAAFTGEDGQELPLVILRHSLDLGRVLAAVAEMYGDQRGLAWPPVAAPYDVHLLFLPGKSLDTRQAADGIYASLLAAGLRVLYDDRDERAGVKFNDADLIGVPVRVTAGERALQAGSVELKLRRAAEAELVPLADLAARLARQSASA